MKEKYGNVRSLKTENNRSYAFLAVFFFSLTHIFCLILLTVLVHAKSYSLSYIPVVGRWQVNVAAPRVQSC